MTTSKKILIGLGVVLGVGLFLIGWQGARVWIAWNGIQSVGFDLEAARGALPVSDVSQQEGSERAVEAAASDAVSDEYDTVLVIGSDKRPERSNSNQLGAFADAVMLYMMPDDGSGPLIISLPRDLVVTNPCTGSLTKLDRTLEGCGETISGEELVALAVEDFTGIGVDTFASFEFDALIMMIDSAGGIDLCVPYALRDGSRDLLPAGCSTVDGASALAWVRSRETQEFVAGDWRFVQVVGDAARVPRHQALMFALLDRLRAVRSPNELTGLVEGLGDTIVIDASLGLADAVAMAWNLRFVSGSSIRTLVVPTAPTTLDDGSFAVQATMSFAELIGR